MRNVIYDNNWDFHPTVNIEGAYSGSDEFARPHFSTNGLNIGGEVYNSPSVGAWFGCYAAN